MSLWHHVCAELGLARQLICLCSPCRLTVPVVRTTVWHMWHANSTAVYIVH
jgi:hypothetical protein